MVGPKSMDARSFASLIEVAYPIFTMLKKLHKKKGILVAKQEYPTLTVFYFSPLNGRLAQIINGLNIK